jgi:hypothetical protein
MAKILNGNCYLCGAALSKAAMKNHLIKFHGESKRGEACCLIKVEGAYCKDYWLYIDVPMKGTLSDIDAFLRKIWLECCGHMSEFSLPGSGHVVLGKARKLESFVPETKFIHAYDFGTTTETILTVVEDTMRKSQKKRVRLLARNVPPVYQCKDCGKTAEYICTVYKEPYESLFYCAECAEKYEDDEHYMLPVTNSPRMGECGYDGELDTFTFDPASIAQKM